MNPSIFSGTIAITLLSCFLFFRQGFTQNQTEPALIFTGAGLFIIFASQFLNTWTKASRQLLTILLLLLLALIGKLIPHLSVVSILVSSLGALMYIFSLAREFRHKDQISNNLKTLAIAILVGTYTSGMVFSSKYHDAYFLEKLTFGQPFDMGTDTLFHASLANMIANLGRITTGLDGIPFTAYHAGSHIIFAQLCKLLAQGCMPFFIFGYPLLVIPLFFNALTTLTLQLLDSSQKEQKTNSNFIYLALSSLTIGFLPPEGKICDLSGPFIGESYGFGIVLAFFTMAFLLHWFSSNSKDQILWQKILLFLVLIPVICAIMTACKFSTIYLFLSICGYLFLRKKLFLDWIYTGSLILSTAASYLTYKALAFPYQTNFDFFGYYKNMEPGALLFHAIFLYLPLWLLIALSANKQNKNEIFKQVEFAVVFAFICFAPSVFSNLAGGVTIYFLEPQYWVSSAMLVAFLAILGAFSNKKFVVLLSAIVLAQTAIGVMRSSSSITESRKILLSKEAPADRQLVMNKLFELSKLPRRTRSHSIVFIAQACKPYWNMAAPLTAPFIVPAITGMPMLDGLPPAGFTGTIYYNYAPYNFGVRRSSTQDESSETLKRNAALWGFTNLIKLDSTDLSTKTENTSSI